MRTTDSRLPADELERARRDEAGSTRRLTIGVAASVAGIAGLIVVLLLFLALGPKPTDGQSFGTLLLAIVAFGLSAWGTDLRHAALAGRAVLRAKVELLESLRLLEGENAVRDAAALGAH